MMDVKETENRLRQTEHATMSIYKDRLWAEIPPEYTIFDTQWVVFEIKAASNERCVMHIIPSRDHGYYGSKTRSKKPVLDGYWVYEKHRGPEDGLPKNLPSFGKTPCAIQRLDNGVLRLETVGPLIPVRKAAKPRGPRVKKPAPEPAANTSQFHDTPKYPFQHEGDEDAILSRCKNFINSCIAKSYKCLVAKIDDDGMLRLEREIFTTKEL